MLKLLIKLLFFFVVRGMSLWRVQENRYFKLHFLRFKFWSNLILFAFLIHLLKWSILEDSWAVWFIWINIVHICIWFYILRVLLSIFLYSVIGMVILVFPILFLNHPLVYLALNLIFSLLQSILVDRLSHRLCQLHALWSRVGLLDIYINRSFILLLGLIFVDSLLIIIIIWWLGFNFFLRVGLEDFLMLYILTIILLRLVNHGTSFFLMLCHIPFRYILFPAIFTNKRSNAGMLPQMDFKIWAGIIFFVTALILAVKFVNVLMRLLVISQDPFLPELRVTSRIRANKLCALVFFMRCKMIG